jgi:hypothetical protein
MFRNVYKSVEFMKSLQRWIVFPPLRVGNLVSLLFTKICRLLEHGMTMIMDWMMEEKNSVEKSSPKGLCWIFWMKLKIAHGIYIEMLLCYLDFLHIQTFIVPCVVLSQLVIFCCHNAQTYLFFRISCAHFHYFYVSFAKKCHFTGNTESHHTKKWPVSGLGSQQPELI